MTRVIAGAMTRVIVFVMALLATACSTLVPSPGGPAEEALSPPEAIVAYGRVLQRFVDDRGWVDFDALARDPGDLHAYVRFVARAPLDSFPQGEARLAHLVNSYNALSMYNVVAMGIPRTHAGLRKVRFFALRKFVIGGVPMSLYAYENDVIRQAGGPLVHFGLNCSAVGCPALPRRPFEARGIHAALESEARRFFSSPRELRVDDRQRVVHVSELLRFYREDFGGSDPAILAFISTHSGRPIPADYSLRFIDYDWTIAHSGRKGPLPPTPKEISK